MLGFKHPFRLTFPYPPLPRTLRRSKFPGPIFSGVLLTASGVRSTVSSRSLNEVIMQIGSDYHYINL